VFHIRDSVAFSGPLALPAAKASIRTDGAAHDRPRQMVQVNGRDELEIAGGRSDQGGFSRFEPSWIMGE